MFWSRHYWVWLQAISRKLFGVLVCDVFVSYNLLIHIKSGEGVVGRWLRCLQGQRAACDYVPFVFPHPLHNDILYQKILGEAWHDWQHGLACVPLEEWPCTHNEVRVVAQRAGTMV